MIGPRRSAYLVPRELISSPVSDTSLLVTLGEAMCTLKAYEPQRLQATSLGLEISQYPGMGWPRIC